MVLAEQVVFRGDGLLDLEQQLRLPVHRRGIRLDFDAEARVVGVGVTARDTGAGLKKNLVAVAHEFGRAGVIRATRPSWIFISFGIPMRIVTPLPKFGR